MKCYGEYLDNDNNQCNGYCDLSIDSCGVCSMVQCVGDINDDGYDPDLYGINALAIWQRALLLASVVILGCICMWGLCYICCAESGNLRNRFNRNNSNNLNMLQVVNDEDPDEVSN